MQLSGTPLTRPDYFQPIPAAHVPPRSPPPEVMTDGDATDESGSAPLSRVQSGSDLSQIILSYNEELDLAHSTRKLVEALSESFRMPKQTPDDFYQRVEKNKVALEGKGFSLLYSKLRTQQAFMGSLVKYLKSSTASTKVNAPFREPNSGVAFFCCRLRELVEAKLETRLPFAQAALQSVSEIAPAQPSDIVRVKELFLSKVALGFGKQVALHDAMIREHCTHFRHIVRADTRFASTHAECLIINVIFLRYVSPEIVNASLYLQKSDTHDPKRCDIAMSMISLSKALIAEPTSEQLAENQSYRTIARALFGLVTVLAQ